MLSYIKDILQIFEYLYKLSIRLHLHRLTLIIFIAIGVNIYFYFFVYQKDSKTEYVRTVEETEIIKEIDKALNDCGDYSFGTWSVLNPNYSINKTGQKGRYLIFKIARSCQKERTKSKKLSKNNKSCIIDILEDNPAIYKEEHLIQKKTLKFIDDDYTMVDGRVFTELSPMCFILIKEDGINETADAMEIKYNAPDFYNIIQDMNLAVHHVCVIKVKDRNNNTVHIFTISFVAISEKSCSISKNRKQIGDYLISIANLSKKMLK